MDRNRKRGKDKVKFEVITYDRYGNDEEIRVMDAETTLELQDQIEERLAANRS